MRAMRAIRSMRERLRLNRYNINTIIKCQSYIRRFLAKRKYLREIEEDKLCGAIIIQTTWRKYIRNKRDSNAAQTITSFINFIYLI